MSVSAVIVNWNGKHYLEACLASVLAQDPRPDEVILADNHSDDGSRAWVAERYPSVKIIDTGSNGGPGLARNAGVAAATHERVLLLDNDVVLRPGALQSLQRTFDAHPDAGMVQARALCFDRPEVVHYDAADLHYLGLLRLHNFFRPLQDATRPAGPVGAGISLCFLTERVKYRAVGGFHEQLFFCFEDTDFSWRLRLLGLQVYLDPDALVLHRGGTADLSVRPGSAQPATRIYYHSRNRPAVLLTCLHWRTLLLTLPPQVVYGLVQGLFALSQRQLGAWVRGKFGLVRLLPTVVRWRREAQRGRVVRDRDLLTAGPLTFTPGVAEHGSARRLRRALDWFFAAWWRIVTCWR